LGFGEQSWPVECMRVLDDDMSVLGRTVVKQTLGQGANCIIGGLLIAGPGV
jgi:hypothetical protein